MENKKIEEEKRAKRAGYYFKPRTEIQRKKIIEGLKNKQDEVLKKFQLKKEVKR